MIKAIRVGQGLAEQGFAQKVEVSVASVRSWENGSCLPNERNWTKILRLDPYAEIVIVDESGSEVCSWIFDRDRRLANILAEAEERLRDFFDVKSLQGLGRLDEYQGKLRYDPDRWESVLAAVGTRCNVRVLRLYSRIVRYEGHFDQY